MSTPRAPYDYSPSLVAAFSETTEPQLPIKLDQTLTPGVYRIVNNESPKVAVDLSGYDRSSVLGEIVYSDSKLWGDRSQSLTSLRGS